MSIPTGPSDAAAPRAAAAQRETARPEKPETESAHGDPAPRPSRQETRERLVEAAAEVFVEEGLQGASVEAICTRAGFSRGAFYSNFSTKEELFLAALTLQYALRAERVRERAVQLAPELAARDTPVRPHEVAHYVTEFFGVAETERAWFALETEFLLLAMRDPSIAPGFGDVQDETEQQIAVIVDGLVAAAGRRFTLPVERVIPILAGVYERALRFSAVAGRESPIGLGGLGDRVAELLFAITEEVDPPRAA